MANDKRPTYRELSQQLSVMAPPDWEPTGVAKEIFDKAKKYSNRYGKRGRQEETEFFAKLIKPYRNFERLAWPEGSKWITRNNNGVWKHPNGYHLRYGLGTGTSDGIGWKVVKITTDMVGKNVAVFMAVEAKKHSKDELKKEQQDFANAVIQAGGIFIKVNANEELKARDDINNA